ncbi:hypothetical protein CFOL_v3_09281 [Cephalotus follicularis]|uniref:Uncharacterized protein n=1 Tax=Cephalotus follicularis TaxID=3775 RepID=A0A1Q3BCK6_CEPFO|nr:hypothetical protein CFOL_v3_09281 [Cephalotus follicularis]
MAASPITLPTLQGRLSQSHFLGTPNLPNPSQKLSLQPRRRTSTLDVKPYAKFNLYEMLGGRGICNGEEGIQEELKRNIEEQAPSLAVKEEDPSTTRTFDNVPDNAFDKELMGLTGGFPGGEKGLIKFIEENPPPKKSMAAEPGNLAGLLP